MYMHDRIGLNTAIPPFTVQCLPLIVLCQGAVTYSSYDLRTCIPVYMCMYVVAAIELFKALLVVFVDFIIAYCVWGHVTFAPLHSELLAANV